MTVKTITKKQYYQVEGLLEVCRQHVKVIEMVEEVLAYLLQEEDGSGGYYGHISDATFSPEMTAKQMLKKMGISVEK